MPTSTARPDRALSRLRCLVEEAGAAFRQWRHGERYEPADHYMRGPGPKTRALSAAREADKAES